MTPSDGVRVGVDIGATILAVLMCTRARRHVRRTWALLGAAAAFSGLVFSLAIRPRLTGEYLEPDLACVALVVGMTAGSRGRWERLFSPEARAQDHPTPDQPRRVALRRNVSGALSIAAYLGLELLFTGAILGIPV